MYIPTVLVRVSLSGLALLLLRHVRRPDLFVSVCSSGLLVSRYVWTMSGYTTIMQTKFRSDGLK